jgi:hypothetical protein
MEYKGYRIIPLMRGLEGTQHWRYGFTIYKVEGREFTTVHRASLSWSYPHPVLAFDAAVAEARALIDVGGPFTY